MKSFEYTITDPVGIHARPAGILAKEAKGYDSVAKKLMALMGLGIKQGDTITVTVEGGDEEGNAAKIEAFFKEHL